MDLKTPFDVYRAIKTEFTDLTKWTQHAFARDKNQHRLYSRDPDAVCWCLTGKITHLCWNNRTLEAESLTRLEEYARELHPQIPHQFSAVVKVNDHMGYDAVIQLLDYAIGKEPKQ